MSLKSGRRLIKHYKTSLIVTNGLFYNLSKKNIINILCFMTNNGCLKHLHWEFILLWAVKLKIFMKKGMELAKHRQKKNE